MEQWLETMLAEVEAELQGKGQWPAAYSTIRRMLYERRWPMARQAEAWHDQAGGDEAPVAAMLAEFAAIKAAVPKPGAV